MNRLPLYAAILGVALAPACQVADVRGVRVTPARAWTSLSGGVAATDLDEDGALRVSSLDDLGVGGRKSNDRLSLQWGGGGDTWELFGYSTDSRGSSELTDDLHFDGVELRFDEGAVDTDLHLGVYGLRWVRRVAQRGPLDVGVGASLLVTEFDIDLDQDVVNPITGDLTGEHKSTGEDALMPFPVPVLDLYYHQESFDARLSLAGLWVWVDEGDGHVIDLDFQILVPMFDDVGKFVCGYHALELELDHSGADGRARLDVSLAGPYVGFSFGF